MHKIREGGVVTVHVYWTSVGLLSELTTAFLTDIDTYRHRY